MIRVRHDVYIHDLPGTPPDPRLDQILSILTAVQTKENEIMADLTDLTAQVAASVTVQESALVLINGFAAQLAAAGTDPAALAALGASLDTEGAALSAAVAANTPAAP